MQGIDDTENGTRKCIKKCIKKIPSLTHFVTVSLFPKTSKNMKDKRKGLEVSKVKKKL